MLTRIYVDQSEKVKTPVKKTLLLFFILDTSMIETTKYFDMDAIQYMFYIHDCSLVSLGIDTLLAD